MTYLEYDDALEIKTSAAKFIHEVAEEIQSELHGRPRGEADSPAFRENPFCALGRRPAKQFA